MLDRSLSPHSFSCRRYAGFYDVITTTLNSPGRLGPLLPALDGRYDGRQIWSQRVLHWAFRWFLYCASPLSLPPWVSGCCMIWTVHAGLLSFLLVFFLCHRLCRSAVPLHPVSSRRSLFLRADVLTVSLPSERKLSNIFWRSLSRNPPEKS